MEIINSKRAEYSEKNEKCQSINGRLKEKANNCHSLKYDVENWKKRVSHLESIIVDLQQNIAQRSKLVYYFYLHLDSKNCCALINQKIYSAL